MFNIELKYFRVFIYKHHVIFNLLVILKLLALFSYNREKDLTMFEIAGEKNYQKNTETGEAVIRQMPQKFFFLKKCTAKKCKYL